MPGSAESRYSILRTTKDPIALLILSRFIHLLDGVISHPLPSVAFMLGTLGWTLGNFSPPGPFWRSYGNLPLLAVVAIYNSIYILAHTEQVKIDRHRRTIFLYIFWCTLWIFLILDILLALDSIASLLSYGVSNQPLLHLLSPLLLVGGTWCYLQFFVFRQGFTARF